ncbi:MAG: alginate O-acetyltransferase AlgX-related protein [Limisphaerales bacterium]
MSDEQKSRLLEKRQSVVMIVFVAVFFVVLWLPMMDVLFYQDKVAQVNENRVLARFPVCGSGISGVQDFISGLGKYYDDHFGFRKRLIYWGERWRLSWFDESPTGIVMVGQNGWLYYQADQSVGDMRRTTSFSVNQLEAWKTLLENRRYWLAKRGIHYVFVVPPDKHSVYPEYLPSWIKPVGKVTRLDQFMDYMKTHSSVPVLDLRQPLLQAKQKDFIYFQTDSHWNQMGGFIGYQELIHSLSAQMPEIKPLPLNAFDTTTNSQPGGNLAWMLAQEKSITENYGVTFSARPPLQPLSLRKNGDGTKTLSSSNPNATGKAVVFRDSFSEAWAPFIGYHFNEVIYRWQYKWDRALIEQEKPNVVIDEMLEHFFYLQNPVTIASVEGL